MTRPQAHLVLADGTVFSGTHFGAPRVATGEAVFTTGMTGYQEVLTDPSFCGQLVTMTAPQIGNTGINGEDPEARKPFLGGFIIHELSSRVSNWRSTQDLEAYLVEHDIPGIADVDTRALTIHIRDHGAQMAAFGTESPEALLELARAAAPMEGKDLTGEVTTDAAYTWTEGSAEWRPMVDGEGAKTPKRIVAVDYGIKQNILRSLVDHGCEVEVVPASTPADEILAKNPDGIFLSNGPGDPAAATYAIDTVRALIGEKPIFGICLGHQILCLAMGAKTYKLKFGHRGLNQPVKDHATGRIEITLQNHGFVVDPETLPEGVELTHSHLNDGTCQGVAAPGKQAFSVQYHPEAGAGPHDSRYLFQRFVDSMH